MSRYGREWFVLGSLMVVALFVFLAGIGWGLPSRERDDPFLFGGRTPWSGEQIVRLAGERGSDSLGADVDRNPVVRGSEPVVLNGTDEQRAQILRRYRIFTYQPDEMITMMSLASMKPGQRDFDPRLYQYGGLWIYPIGAMLKAASLGGWITLAPSQAYYLDHPEQFGRFYLVARLYTVLWAMIGVWAVWRLAIGAGAGMLGSIGAVALYSFLPVVVNMSHEAKPHLPGAVLILLAALAARRYVESGRTKWSLICGALCGAAAGMIISGVLAFVMIPTMVLLRSMSWRRRFTAALAAGLIGVAVYCVTNPYVVRHLLVDPAILRSNLGNSTAMYQRHDVIGGFLNATRLVSEGATPVGAIAGVIGALVLLVQRKNAKPQPSGVIALIVVSALVLVQFFTLAAGKPGEYGRFAILPDITLALCAAVFIGRARIRPFEKVEALALLVVLAMLPSAIYLKGFLRDSTDFTRRIQYASDLALLHEAGARTIAVFDEPAPYLLPPVDLFSWRILLLPRNFDIASGATPADVIVRPVDQLQREPLVVGSYRRISERTFDDLFPSRISWACKPLEIWVRTKRL